MWTPDIRFYVIEAYLKYSLNVQIIDLPVSPLRIFSHFADEIWSEHEFEMEIFAVLC